MMGGVTGGESLQLLAEESTMVILTIGGGRHGRWAAEADIMVMVHDQ